MPENCKNCGHRVSKNTDKRKAIIEGYHHKHGHGKKPDAAHCECITPEVN